MGGSCKFVRCENTNRCVPKDKAVKRWTARNMFDASTMRDVSDACVYGPITNLKVYYKSYYSLALQFITELYVQGRRNREELGRTQGLESVNKDKRKETRENKEKFIEIEIEFRI